MSTEIEYKIKDFIEKHQLLSVGDELVLGVSGGADSMMLFHYLYTHQDAYQIKLKVAHVQHGMREEGIEDAQLVEAVCKQRKIPFYRHDCDVKYLSRVRQLSEEEVGREERYNFFISLLNNSGKIVTAHNMNDQAETLIMRFLRGTGIRGLAGIAPKRAQGETGIQIIRPLLCLSREEIECYCKVYDLEFRQDHTNFLPIYTRNKIRLQCIPYIKEKINPAIIRVLGEHSDLYREEESFIEEHTQSLFMACTQEHKSQININEELFMSYHTYMQKRIVIKCIERLIEGSKDITSKHIESSLKLIKGESGRQISLPYGLIVYKDYNELIIKKEVVQNEQYIYPLQLGKQFIKEAGLEVTLSLVDTTHETERIEQKDEKIYTKYIDYGKMKNGLFIRTRLQNDYMYIGTGTKKLNRLFIDDKVSRPLRDTWPLIADGDEIIWIVGRRFSTNYYITPETTQVLQIQIIHSNY